MILILTNKLDVSADFVIQDLRIKSQDTIIRLNTEDLPMRELSVKLPDFSYTVPSKSGDHDLVHDLRSVWFRRPGKPFEFLPKEERMSPQVIAYVRNQWRVFIEGLVTIDSIFWINNPYMNQISENKIGQLKTATELGLKIPQTCITTSRSEALNFYKSCEGNIIAKALDSPLIQEPESDFFIFTNTMKYLDEYSESEFGISPTIFQERIFPKIDYRVTVVGDCCFVAKIENSSDNSSNIDWRAEKKNLRFYKSDMPQDIIDKCIKLVRRYGLIFGAIDVVEHKDAFYFLEINPNGEWGWL